MRQTLGPLGHGLSRKGYEMVVMYIHLPGRLKNAQRASYLYTFVGFSCQESCGRAHGSAGIFDLLTQVFSLCYYFCVIVFVIY
jgi:hypothetical protein